MNRDDETILSEATGWLVASEGPDADMDWDAFTHWLEADARHRHAYDEVALTGLALDDHRSELALAPQPASILETATAAVANDAFVSAPARFTRGMRWGGFAIAASLAAVLVVPRMIAPAPVIYQTQGSPERIALADGSTVLLAPHSALSLADKAGGRMTLEGGALFDIRHDPARRMNITAGALEVHDIGTRFDIQAEGDAVRVAVDQGNLEVTSQALDAPVRLAAGKGLSFDGRAGTATVAPVRAGTVGAWQKHRLSYDNAPLALVVSDLRRYAGVSVDVPVSLRDRRFSGTLIVDSGEAAVRDLAQLMGLRLSGRTGAWRLDTSGS